MHAKVLVVGAGGQLGRQLLRELGVSFAVTGTFHEKAGRAALRLDLRDPAGVAEVIRREDPTAVVIAAAHSNAAFCSAHPDLSAAVNVEGVRNAIEGSRGRALVFFSTDAVFDGSRRAFREEDTPRPLTVYGRHKRDAEELVRQMPDHLIVRSARFYDRERGDGRFVDHAIRTLSAGRELHAPLETPGNPTFVEELARATRVLLERGHRGTWHVAGPPVASLYETACTVARVFGADERLVRAVERDHGSATPRITSVLDTEKALQEGIRLSTLEEGLVRIRDGS